MKQSGMTALDHLKMDQLVEQDATLREQLAEMATQMQAVMVENETLTRFLSTDATRAGLLAEIKRLTAQVETLRERNAGLMEEKNAAIRAAKQPRKPKA